MSCSTSSKRLSRAENGGGIPTRVGQAAYATITGLSGALGRRVSPVTTSLSRTSAGIRTKMNQVQAGVDQATAWAQQQEGRLAQAVAPLSNHLVTGLAQTNRFGADRLVSGYMARKLFGSAVRPVRKAISVSEKATALAGSGLADLSRKSLAASVVQEKRVLGLFKKKAAVQLWNSHLTSLLNRGDRPPGGMPVVRSSGRLLKVSGVTWHRGTTVVRTPDGDRTLTHLQRLSYPSARYYFERRLTDKETAGLTVGDRAFQPQRMTGYLGQIAPTESLVAGWAATKHNLFKLRAYYPSGDPPAPPQRNAGRLPNERELGELKETADRTTRKIKGDLTTAIQGG